MQQRIITEEIVKSIDKWNAELEKRRHHHPWVTVKDVNKVGRRHLHRCPKQKREIHLLSDGEKRAYKVLVWRPDTLLVKEQVPLDLNETLDIANELGFLHSGDYKTKAAHVMSTDFYTEHVIFDSGELDVEAFDRLLSEKTKLVAFPHVSNALGTVNPIKQLTQKAKAVGAWVLVDGAQGIAHGGVDVQDIGCDFYAFSGHKLFGPTGIGCLWGKKDVLETWPVWQVGGEMIKDVTYHEATWGALPNRLEAGTPNIAGAIGMGAAVDWFSALDVQALHAHEQQLLAYATEQAQALEGMRIIGTAPNKVGVLSFLLDGAHPADVGFILDRQGVAIRTGDNCAQPLMKRFGIPGTARASFSIYNTLEEVDSLFAALKKAKMMLA